MIRTYTTDQGPHDASDIPEASPAPPIEVTDRPLILHLYSGNLYGGIETLLATLARSGPLGPPMGMEYALCFPGRLDDELRAAGAAVHDLGPVQFRYPWTIARARVRLARLLRQRPFDVVVTHACWPHALFAPVVRRARRPLVFWQHDFAGTGHWLDRLAARNRPDLVISNSRASAATLPALFPNVPVEVIYYPVSPPDPLADAVRERVEVRRELDTSDDSVVIIQVSRMERWKGQSLFLEALARLRDRPGWMAWIVGGAQRPREQEYIASLKTQATAAGIGDRVRFTGQRQDVARLLAAADIHCQPNIGPEPFGISFVEALYAGLPVISTRMGGAVEIVSKECGVLVEPGDVSALAGALQRLIDDALERTRLGQSGPAAAAKMCDPGSVLCNLSLLLSDLGLPIDVVRCPFEPGDPSPP